MFTATMRIYSHSHVFVHIELQWIFAVSVDFGYWSCAPGWFGRGVASGTWDSSWMSDALYLKDPDGALIAQARDIDVSYFGYPLHGLQGDTGDFWLSPPGNGGKLTGYNSLAWHLLSI